jgi:hypothetical protein
MASLVFPHAGCDWKCFFQRDFLGREAVTPVTL